VDSKIGVIAKCRCYPGSINTFYNRYKITISSYENRPVDFSSRGQFNRVNRQHYIHFFLFELSAYFLQPPLSNFEPV